MPLETKTLSGKVHKRTVNQGSKSEHDAVTLVTEAKEYILRRKGGKAFSDSILDGLVGKTIEASGTVHSTTFIMDAWKIKNN